MQPPNQRYRALSQEKRFISIFCDRQGFLLKPQHFEYKLDSKNQLPPCNRTIPTTRLCLLVY
ncbi:hypothetical protein H6F93_16155 [Leptolyngbya sp. FACHB-671]|nr:hypothetical protein [Leptolyngbya sp. FACHB-671]